MKTNPLRALAFTILAFLCSFTFHNATAADSLYNREINQKNPGGKDLIMKFQELSRTDKTSTVKVTFGSGASVPSVMFIVRGFYDIAQLRKTPYFIKLKGWKDVDGGWIYLVGFSRDKSVDPQKYFDMTEPFANASGHPFMAVEDYELIFKPRQ